MLKILFITNIPSPYRVDFFNEIGKHTSLTVCYERCSASDRSTEWKPEKPKSYNEIYADVKPFRNDASIGLGVVKVIKKSTFDCLVISGYSSPSVAAAIIYCRLCHIQFYYESDGGFYKKDNLISRGIKKYLLCGAKGHLTTCDEHIKYLKSLGIDENKIFKYPFSSLMDKDILNNPPDVEGKNNLREKLGIHEKKVIVSVGQFIYRKGFDVLLEACKSLGADTGIYCIGGEVTADLLHIKNDNNLLNVHFVDFQNKDNLKLWYMSADCFVLPTREDIWGLVVNEAMANALPVITTDRCNAGLELVRDGYNGYIVPAGNAEELNKAMINVLSNCKAMGENSLKLIKGYTIEEMVKIHLQILMNTSEVTK